MALDDQDKQKLHNAINQIDNQRLVLTTLAITFFGTGIGWWMGKTPAEGPDVRFTYIFSFALMAVLFLLFLYSMFLKRMLRTFSTYLILQDASTWEKDRFEFRTSEEFHIEWHERADFVVFLCLGLAAALFPILVLYLYKTPISIRWLLAHIITSIVYLLFIFRWGIGNRADREKQIRDQWEKAIAKNQSVTNKEVEQL